MRCDVRDYSQLIAFAQACEEKLGGIDIVVNNAGVASGGFFDELSLEDWDWQIAINLMGVVKGCKAFLPLVQKSKGKIINIASMAALMQAPGMSNYNVAKAGVVALSESLLVELRQAEVGVHVVCPSFFQTNLLDSFRGPTPNVKAQIGKLLESSPITAADIADYIHQQVAKGEFMILPHDEGPGRSSSRIRRRSMTRWRCSPKRSGPRARLSETARPLSPAAAVVASREGRE